MRTSWATALIISLSAVSNAALAGEPGGDDDVVVTGKRDGYGAADTAAAKTVAPLRDLPQSVAVITAAVLRAQRALSLQDALKNVPGVGFSTGDGQRAQVTIRGFSAIADHYVNGFRDDALYFRDLSNTERVEVIKGPAAVLYGRGSSGGLINRVLKRPDVDVSSATLTGGGFDRRRAEWNLGRYAAASELGLPSPAPMRTAAASASSSCCVVSRWRPRRSPKAGRPASTPSPTMSAIAG